PGSRRGPAPAACPWRGARGGGRPPRGAPPGPRGWGGGPGRRGGGRPSPPGPRGGGGRGGALPPPPPPPRGRGRGGAPTGARGGVGDRRGRASDLADALGPARVGGGPRSAGRRRRAPLRRPPMATAPGRRLDRPRPLLPSRLRVQPRVDPRGFGRVVAHPV